MAKKDWYTNIMLDLECADAEAHNPVLLELAAVHFDVDTGEELGHYSTIISYQSCLDHGLVDDIIDEKDGETTIFLKKDPILKYTRLESKASEIPLEYALSEFTKFVERSRQRTLKVLEMRSPPQLYTQPMIWGNGAVADNVWITSAYKACDMARPWKFYNNMCVRTFVQQAKTMTGRDFKREVSNGKKHDALSDCRTQVEYLVNARNTLMPQPRERMLPSPEVSFSSAAGKVEPARTLLSPEVSFSSTDGNVEEALRSAASALLEPPPSNDAALLETFLPSDEVETEVTQAQAPESSPSGGHGFRDVPYKVVKPPPTVSPRRRNFKPKTPRQLLTPETSFSAEEYEKEYELGKQEDQRMFSSQG